MTAKILLAATALIVASTATASAASVRPVERRAENQAYRIEQGRQTGQITWREGRKLRKEQREIDGLKHDFLADGYLSRREARVLKQKQETASWNIINEKYDGWRRWRFLPRVGR